MEKWEFTNTIELILNAINNISRGIKFSFFKTETRFQIKDNNNNVILSTSNLQKMLNQVIGFAN